MSFFAFLQDKILWFLYQFVCIGVLSGFLTMTGYTGDCILLIQICWVFLIMVNVGITYLRRRGYFREIEKTMENIDKRYLLGELMPHSHRLEDKLYQDIIRRSNKSVIEKIRYIEEEQREYREYIESWVHEVKAPITGIGLLCENRRKGADASEGRDFFRSISVENRKIENYVDMALYYARSEQVYRDYIIRETDLQQVVYDVLEKNRLLLIQNSVRVEVDCGENVYTDKKWIGFIIDQILLNSVKYRREDAVFLMTARRMKNSVIFTVEDNGTGIRREELPRIFEKGFTGSNGRGKENSTGMGLYLCRKLCDKLGIGISAQSCYGEWTKVMLEFPLSSYIGECRKRGS